MNYILAVFRSRTHAKLFADALSAYGVSCRIVQTPTSLKLGCGKSVNIAQVDFFRAKRILQKYASQLKSFAGFYEGSKVSNLFKRIEL